MLSTQVRRTVVMTAAAAVTLGAAVSAPALADDTARTSYIVVLRDDVQRPGSVADEHRRNKGAHVTHTYRTTVKGYAAKLTRRGRAEVLRDPRVAYVEPDGVVTTQDTQAGAPWGLDRIDAVTGLDTTYSYETTGRGVTAYVLDTGIRASHTVFGGRVADGYSVVEDGWGTDDCHGHGTHVAGTLGGAASGVAKGATLVPVRVLDCQGHGTWSGVLAAVEWVTANAQRPAVANMSLAGGAIASVDAAVERSIASGVTYAVAAGNDGGDACQYSPARTPGALTVSATDATDTRAGFANTGACVDLFAPGVDVVSAVHWDDSATAALSGTSMAAPHVAGAVARYLEGAPTATPSQVAQALSGASTKGVVASAGTADNALLYVAPPTQLAAPVMSEPVGGTTSSTRKPRKRG